MLLCVLGACANPSLVDCGDGTVCPGGFACVQSQRLGQPVTTCADPDAQAACAGKSDGATCTLSNSPGTCAGGACAVPQCGDGGRRAAEVCDDGNTVSGDGCNGTCSSNESCGNGILELAEECDCGDAAHPGPASCHDTVNGGGLPQRLHARALGDGVVDPGEVCDLGADNGMGKGYSFDCQSNESRGNGILDFFAGETRG